MSPLFYFIGEFPHGPLRDDASFAVCQGGLGILEACQEFRPLALTFLPQGESFPNGFFFALQASALDGLPDKGFLVGRKMNFHTLLA
jgi:hypothetical protein